VACPFFEPLQLLPPRQWTHRPRLPLGEAWSGRCHAGGEPTGEEQFELCNHGYARGQCPSFPSSCLADAVRFSVTREEPLRLIYILEKDHAPLEHGELPPNEILAAQARAFLSTR
jgi:hypothetical protein